MGRYGIIDFTPGTAPLEALAIAAVRSVSSVDPIGEVLRLKENLEKDAGSLRLFLELHNPSRRCGPHERARP